MSIIDKLIEFKPRTKALSAEVNSNFETLRLSNNQIDESLNNLKQEFQCYKECGLIEIECESDILELDDKIKNYKVTGSSEICEFTGIINGIVFIEFASVRLLVNSAELKLQNNVDRVTKAGDIGIYVFENEKVKEINYFTSKEELTNSFPTQTILDAPRNIDGKADFLEKIEFSENIMPIMESNENDVCIISASSQYDTVNYPSWKAFRHHTNDIGGWLTINGVNTGWLKIHFKNNSPKVSAFSINARNVADANTHSPCDFVIEGSNDDTNWTLLGDYSDNLNWLQNEKRYFALTFIDNFKYYRLSITKNSGGGTFSGFGALELYQSLNDFMPLVARANISAESPLLVNTGIGKSTVGKTNQLSILSKGHTIENLLNNSQMYIGYFKNSENRFEHFVTTACPVYTNSLQRYSNKNSVPTMISNTTSNEFKFGYVASASSHYTPQGGSYPAFFAFNRIWTNKWVANVVGGNQWLQIDFPNYRKVARFTIIASHDDPGGSVTEGCIKGFNGEEWIVLKKIHNETGWTANEVRHFDADIIENCSKFKLEIIEIQNPAIRAQIAEFQIHELANCFLIPENKFYSYNIETEEFEEQEMIFIGRIKTQNNFVSEVQSFAIENKYISPETELKASTLYSFFHNLGVEYKNLKINGWIKDKVNGVVLPWCVDSNLDAAVEFNNYGYVVDECQFDVRTPSTIMRYKNAANVMNTVTANATLVIQIERNF